MVSNSPVICISVDSYHMVSSPSHKPVTVSHTQSQTQTQTQSQTRSIVFPPGPSENIIQIIEFSYLLLRRARITVGSVCVWVCVWVCDWECDTVTGL